MLFRNRGQNIPVVDQTLFRRPVGYLFALNFEEAGVLTYDSSPTLSNGFDTLLLLLLFHEPLVVGGHHLHKLWKYRLPLFEYFLGHR